MRPSYRGLRLFSALDHELKQLEYVYFHNSLYDFVWQDKVPCGVHRCGMVMAAISGALSR